MDCAKARSARNPGQLGGEVARREGIDAHAVLAPDRSEVPSEVDQGSFGGVVGSHRAAGGDDAVHRRNVDHAGRGRGPQEVRGQSAQVHNADQVDLDHPPQVVQRLLSQWPVVAGAGVVDQHVESAMSAHYLNDSLPVMRVGDVAGDGLHPVPAVLLQLVETVSAAGGGDDMGAGANMRRSSAAERNDPSSW